MQSETADFAPTADIFPGAATRQTGRNIRVVSDFVFSLFYVKT